MTATYLTLDIKEGEGTVKYFNQTYHGAFIECSSSRRHTTQRNPPTTGTVLTVEIWLPDPEKNVDVPWEETYEAI